MLPRGIVYLNANLKAQYVALFPVNVAQRASISHTNGGGGGSKHLVEGVGGELVDQDFFAVDFLNIQ